MKPIPKMVMRRRVKKIKKTLIGACNDSIISVGAQTAIQISRIIYSNSKSSNLLYLFYPIYEILFINQLILFNIKRVLYIVICFK